MYQNQQKDVLFHQGEYSIPSMEDGYQLASSIIHSSAICNPQTHHISV